MSKAPNTFRGRENGNSTKLKTECPVAQNLEQIVTYIRVTFGDTVPSLERECHPPAVRVSFY